MAVQQERLSERGHECYEPFPNPNVPTPECVAWLLVAWVFTIDVMLFTNLRLLQCSCLPSFSSLCTAEGVPSSPSFFLSLLALLKLF